MTTETLAATAVLMPRLTDSMEEGTILRWFKSVGEEIAAGEELLEIETDKAAMVFEADTTGTLLEIVAGEGATVPIGAVIAQIGDPGAAAAPTPPPLRRAVSPVARRMAEQLGVDLASIDGTGPGGRIVKADVEAAPGARSPSGDPPAPGPPEAPPVPAAPADAGAKGAVEVVELTRVQQTIGRRMAESKATAPDFHLQANADMRRCLELRAQLKALSPDGAIVPSLNDLVVKACALALRETPRANGAYRDGRWELYSRVNVGVAVAAPDALIVPTIFDADRKGLREIAVESRELAARVRDGRITPPELAGGTFTVSNLGMYGIASFTPVLNAGQAAILGVGEVAAGGSMTMTLVCDHRILYGADAAVFIGGIRTLLEAPLGLAL